jgi:hypothetical protein
VSEPSADHFLAYAGLIIVAMVVLDRVEAWRTRVVRAHRDVRRAQRPPGVQRKAA